MVWRLLQPINQLSICVARILEGLVIVSTRSASGGERTETSGIRGAAMDSLPSLSVLIPSYNCSEWLDRSIRSAMMVQGCLLDIIVVDDGSTDNTPELLDRLKGEFPLLRCFRTVNQGLSSARNFGLSRALGEYVLLLDSDDELLPCDVSSLLLSQCDMVRIGVEEILDGQSSLIVGDTAGVVSGRNYLSACFGRNTFYTPSWAYLYKLDWLRKNELSFEHGLLHEDNLFTVQALLKAESVLVVPTLVYRYIRRPDSITTASDEHKLLARIRAYSLISFRLTGIANEDPSFDLRWKIYEVLDGAFRLANRCSGRQGKLIALRALLKFTLSYRGFGGYACRCDQVIRLARYTYRLIMHRGSKSSAGLV